MAGKKKKKSKTQKSVSKSRLVKDLDILWSEYVRRRDGKCVRCGSRKSLNAHHIFGRRHLSTRWEPDNGITLCSACHLFWAHRDPGGFMNWWEEKFETFLGKDVRKKHNEIWKPTTEELESLKKTLNPVGL